MREQGWTGGKMEERRRVFEEKARRKGKQTRLRENVQRVLGFNHRWWGDEDDAASSSSDIEDDHMVDVDIFVGHLTSTSPTV
jgi:hypothetical protein